MGQMLYQSKALIELSMKIFFSNFSDHFVQSYKRSKFRVWVAWGPKASKRRAGGPPCEGRRPELRPIPEGRAKTHRGRRPRSLGARAEGPSLRPIPKGRAKTHRGRRPRSLGARAEGPSFDPSRKAEERPTEAEGRGVWGRGPKARA